METVRQHSYRNLPVIPSLSSDFTSHIASFLSNSDKAILLDIPFLRHWVAPGNSLEYLVLIRLERRRECKTWCKTNYKMSKEELQKLPVEIKHKSHLFKLSDIVQTAANRLGLSILETINWKNNMKRNRNHNAEIRNKKREEAKREYEQKVVKLANAFEAAGLELQQDNRLCKQYLDAKSSFSCYDLIQIMSKMKYLRDFTNYESLLKSHSTFDAENIALARFGVPKKWPWTPHLPVVFWSRFNILASWMAANRRSR